MIRGICCRGGFCRSTAWKTYLNFGRFLRHAKRSTTSMVFYHNLLYWISLMLGQGRARLAKNMQEHVFIDVPRPGNMLAARGGYTCMRPCRQTMPRKWVPWVTNPTPSNKGLQTAWPEKGEKFREIVFRTQKWFCLRSQQCFFFTKSFRTFFTVLPEGFARFFHDFFAHFFALFFARLFSQDFSHVPFTHFSDTFVHSCVAQRVFIVCSLSTAYLSPRQVIRLLVDQARHSWPNTPINKWKKLKVFGRVSTKFSLCRQSAIRYLKILCLV